MLKIIALLQLLDRNELERLTIFIKSPYFNVLPDVFIYLSYLIDLAKQGQLSHASQTDAYQLAYTETYRDSKMRRLRANAVQVVEYFCAQLQREENNYYVDLMHFYANRPHNGNDFLTETMGRCAAILEKQPMPLAQYYELKTELTSALRVQQTTQGKQTIEAVRDHVNSDSYHFIVEHTHLQVVYFIATRRLNMNECKQSLNCFLKWTESLHITDPQLQIPLNILRFITADSNTYADYHKFKENIENYQTDIPTKYRIYQHMTNYCAVKFNEGQIEYAGESSFWLNAILQKNEYSALYQQEVSPKSYFNDVLIMITNNDTESAKEFIRQYKVLLAADRADAYYTYAEANILLKEKKYEEADELLKSAAKMDGRDDFLKLIDYRTSLRLLYEMGLLEVLKSRIASFKAFISKHPNSPHIHHDSSQNFANLLNKLATIAQLPNTNKQRALQLTEALAKELTATKPVTSTLWLRQMIAEHAERLRK